MSWGGWTGNKGFKGREALVHWGAVMGASSLVRKRRIKKHVYFHNSVETGQILPGYLLLNALVEHTWLSLFSLYHLYRRSLSILEASTCTPSTYFDQTMHEGQGR